MGAKVRLSNFELLRIICMFGVLTTHTLQHLYDLQTPNFSVLNEMRVFIMNAGCLAVNCFVMISGYFQIHQSWRGFVKLVSTCFFWALICSCSSLIFDGIGLMEAGKHVLFPLTGGGGLMWFMVAYLGLYLIAPLLNSGINSMDDTRLGLTVLMLIIIDVYIGYMHQSKEVTIDGYHLVHFIDIYVLAAFIRRKALIFNKKKLGMAILMMLVIMTGLHMVKMFFFPISVLYSMRYNSPVLMLTSVLVFIWFSQLKFQLNVINKISASVLAVYLISSQDFVANRIYGWFQIINDSHNGVVAFLLVVLAMIGFYAMCVVLETLRKVFFAKFEDRVSDKLLLAGNFVLNILFHF